MASQSETVLQDRTLNEGHELQPCRSRHFDEEGHPVDEQQLPIQDAMTNVAELEPVPPNGGYGWVCTLAVFLINVHTWGINASWAIIMAHFSNESDKMNGSHFEYAIIGGLSISQALIISPIVTASHKHLGVRPTLFIGSVLIFVSLLTSSFATSVWQLILSQGFCFGWGMGFVYITGSAVLPLWFSSHRSLAVGISTSGSGLGGLIYSLITNAVIQGLGIEWSYRVLAFCALFGNLLACALLKDATWRSRASAASLEDMRFNIRDFGRVEIMLIVFWGFATELGYIALLYSLPSYAASVGLTPTQGSVANALLNLGLGLGRPPMGWLSDTLGRINIALLMTALCATFCFTLWIPAQSFALLSIFALLAGATCGTFWCSITPVLGEIVGLRKLGGTFGVVAMSLVLPTTFAEVVVFELAKFTGSEEAHDYTGTQIFVGFMFVAGTLGLWLLRSWKGFDVERKREQESGAVVSDSSRSMYQLSWLKPRFLFRLWHV